MPARPGLGPCSIEGCDRDTFARGWCTMHYNRWRRDGDPGPVGPARQTTPTDGTCMVEGCSDRVAALRLCDRHYRRYKAHGDPGPAERVRVKNAGKPCSVDGCDRGAKKRGMCGMHYLRWRQTGDPGEAASRYVPTTDDGMCSVDGCEQGVWQKRLCSMHAHRLRKFGDVGSPKRIKARVGAARFENRDGYVLVRCEPEHPAARKGYLLEHRLVMERRLGRYLLPNENVHHKNGVRNDNRPENLELWVKAQPCGQRVADLVSFVVANYPEYVKAALEGRPHLFPI